jgi:TfoX/Sxy family transcriptional regulator of competence genes
MAAPRSSEAALEQLDLLVAELGDPAIARGRMMGRPILTRDGTMFACLNGEVLGVKLGAGTPEHAAALAIPGAELFDPSTKGRPFKDWVSLPLDAADDWVTFGGYAVAFVAAT